MGETTRSYFAGTVQEFLATPPETLLGRMSARLAEHHRVAERDQIRAWTRQIDLLRSAFGELGEAAQVWSILFEAPILRLGRRMDVVVLAPGVVIVVEFKIGATSFAASAVAQTEYYALSLRDFHAASQERIIVPLLCADQATGVPLELLPIQGGVAQTQRVGATDLATALRAAAAIQGGSLAPLDANGFENSPYTPTPTIIEAARALYAGHTILELGRGDAATHELQEAASRLVDIVLEARDQRELVICFVTGTPGAGKTLLGLDLALKSRIAGGGLPPSSLLSGNPPLVHVLVEALAHDAHTNRGLNKPQARREASSAVQGLLGFLREHDQGALPPEHVIVFDEAQRAWDAEVGLKLLNRKRSEPALFLDIMARSEWACLICLVGPGQEINRGEGGLALWGEALREASRSGKPWRVCAAPQVVAGGPDVGSAGLQALAEENELDVRSEPQLHLSNAMRAYRNPLHVSWVTALLNGEIDRAANIASNMLEPPALLTRSLGDLRAWLRVRRRGGRSVGLLTSSGNVRAIAEGLPPAPRSNELDAIAHWFLKPFHDYRSASALELPLSEFGCQGLELDYTGLCWGGDLIWRDGWTARSMAAPKWRGVSQTARQQYRLNGYRVLLTRARAGSAIFVPLGSADDDTRRPAEFSAVAKVLLDAGCAAMPQAEGF